MNYNSRLLLTYLRGQPRPIKKILNISSEPLELPDRYRITQMNPNNGEKITLKDIQQIPANSFDFVYSRNPSYIFGLTSDTYHSIARTAPEGMILNVSPIAALLHNMELNHIAWTNSTNVSNTLCIAEYSAKKLNKVKVAGWDQICLNRPYFLYDWYAWKQPSDFAVKLYLPADYNTNAEYFELINEAINLSAENTHQKIINK